MMGFFDKFKTTRKKVVSRLDEDRITDNEIIETQQGQIVARDSQIAKIYSKEKLKRDLEKESDKKNELNKKLREQKLDLDANKYGKVIKLKKFYKDLMSNKWKNKPLEITDKNDEVVLGRFGDFGFMEGGKMCIIDDKGEIMSYGKNINQVLYKADAFENMVRRGRFTIPMDKDGNWMEDIEYKEIPEPLDAEFDEETGKIKRIVWSKVKTSEVKKVIGLKMEEINMLSQELDLKENTIIKQKKQINDLKRSLMVTETESNISQSELSKNLNIFLESEKRRGEMHTQITKLTELKSMYENLIERKDEVISKMMSKIDQLADPNYEVIKASIKDDLEFYRAMLPEKVEIHQDLPIEQKQLVQPGNPIK